MFTWGNMANHCREFSTNFWKQKVYWHQPAMFYSITSSKHSCQQFEFSLKVKVMRSNPGYPLKSFLLYTSKMCCCILRNSQSARKLILFSDCFSLLFQLLVFFLLPGIFALTTPLGIFAHIAPEKVCAVSVRKTVKLSTMGHFLVLHTPPISEIICG